MTLDLTVVEDRAKEHNICGEIRNSGRFEWVCGRAPHGAEKGRSQKCGADGRPGYWPKAARHLFKRRWPNGDR